MGFLFYNNIGLNCRAKLNIPNFAFDVLKHSFEKITAPDKKPIKRCP